MFFLIFFATHAFGAPEDKGGHPREGNFILPAPQRQGPLVSFGQNILEKGVFQANMYADDFGGARIGVGHLQPFVVYGITNDTIALLNIPIQLQTTPSANVTETEGQSASSSGGFGDAVLQFETVVWKNAPKDFEDQATLVANVIVPTSAGKSDDTETEGNYSFLLGGTFSRMYANWYMFTSEAFIPVTSHHGTKPGYQFLYQCGLGRTLFTIDQEWLFAFLVEMDGQYSESDRINGKVDPNSGGNAMILTPSFFISSEHFIFRAGVGCFPMQRLRGNQAKEEYLLVGNLTWTFW